MKKYVCTVCGYIAEGSIPDFCPVCKAPASKFIEKTDNSYVTEHVVGIAKDAEEAEHASKFAELLGEVLTDSTKKNLQMRVDAESGACAGKMELAKKAKALNLDAIHDTVHEMAKDEARHGRGMQGLLVCKFSSISLPSNTRSYHLLAGSVWMARSCGVTGRLKLLGKKLIWPLVSSMAHCTSFKSKYPATLVCAKNSFRSILARSSSAL